MKIENLIALIESHIAQPIDLKHQEFLLELKAAMFEIADTLDALHSRVSAIEPVKAPV